jgi:catechol 2,3-dioxygenase-like lactoylglutathione lyase family enzyme
VEPLFRKVDCLSLPVRDLDGALGFYRDRLGHELVWRSETAAGLRLADGDSELVLHTDRPQAETDLLVGSVSDAVKGFSDAGGKILAGPFEIQVGMCAVVQDPFDNVLTILDTSKGRFVTDSEGRIVGNERTD